MRISDVNGVLLHALWQAELLPEHIEFVFGACCDGERELGPVCVVGQVFHYQLSSVA